MVEAPDASSKFGADTVRDIRFTMAAWIPFIKVYYALINGGRRLNDEEASQRASVDYQNKEIYKLMFNWVKFLCQNLLIKFDFSCDNFRLRKHKYLKSQTSCQ